MKWIWIIFLALISDTYSIQTRTQRPVRFVDQKAFPTRTFRHIDGATSVPLDWEHGLREATIQALIREHVGDHNLRKHIYSAPLLGKQDKATPFGDIAVLARGQLYANYAGYTFVQDPYQNDCDDCHNIDAELVRGRCINHHCQIWHPRNNEQLIALWSIKRIRHRSLKDEYNRLEVEFTVSPIDLRHPGYLTKEGTFNYHLPGHVFVLRNLETHQNLHSVQNVNPLKHGGAFIAQTPDGRKFILHSFPAVFTPETPRYQTPKDSLPTTTLTTTQYSEEDAKKVYQTLLEVLHKKTSMDPNRFVPPTSKATTTISDTTLVQLPDGQVVPITELETPFIKKTTPGYVTVRFPETSSRTTSINPFSKPHVTPQSSVPTTSQTYGTSTPKETTPHDFYTSRQQTTFVAPPTTNGYTPQTPKDFYDKPRPFYTKPTTKPPGRTEPPVKMTFHFFAAEEEKATQKPPSTVPQQVYTEKEHVLPDTVVPTEPTKFFPTEYRTTEELKGTVYQETTRKPFLITRPATVVKVSKPIAETTYFSNEISSNYHTTEASTNLIPTIPYESFTTTYYATQKPFAIPITVLDEKQPSTVEVNQTPSTSVREPTVTVGSIEYTHFYNPTTTKAVAPQERTTTVLQETTAVLENKASTRDSTTYTRVPTIETALGETTIMGSSQNKTTEMIYYAAEETTKTPTTLFTSTVPTNALKETEPASTPKRIVTTIGADGSVSVKTTPFYVEDELFGLTKSSTKKHKTTKSYKVSTTEASDFLVEDFSQDYKRPLFKKPLKDYDEDEIFGATKHVYPKISQNDSVTRKYNKSDIEEALFDHNSRKSKALIRRKPSTTESTPPKVLYSNFFEASTLAMTKQPHVTTLPSVETVTSSFTTYTKAQLPKVHKLAKEEDKKMPVTSQSYLTSISYEVNRRKKPLRSETLANNKKVTENNEKQTTTEMTDDDNKGFHDFAWRLVSQAKGVAYLDNITTTSVTTVASTSARTTKKPKYARRRSYVPRAKRPKKRKIVDSDHNR